MIALSLIVILPFFSALILALIYLQNPTKNREKLYAKLALVTPIISTILSFVVAVQLFSSPHDLILHHTLFNWIDVGELHIELAFMADRLTAVMLSFITFIGTLIHIYAIGYMRGDAGYGKFFTYFNLFMGSMLLLILADNPIIMFVGWELVGLSSYLLIGFYHQESQNITAANKAFMVNRIGDFGFIMGLSLLFVVLEGNGYSFSAIEQHIDSVDRGMLTLIGGLLFIGAMGKSAQIPLYVWLPDAMAGPTPVSALIHAATMVTAGVYMVARFSFLYIEIPQMGEAIALVGAISALFAAIIASFQDDIKKILAYSTMSQLGYMFIAVGLGAYSSGIFHVFTHAFFKALLFMGAGAVIIALHHEQNIFRMGGLKKELKWVYIPMLIATLAISGIPPFAGFFSKDAILITAFATEHYTIWAMATATAMLTAYYMFRLLFVVFHSAPKSEHNLIKLPSSMTKPLIVLAIGSATAGLLGVGEAYGGTNLFASFLALPDTPIHIEHQTEYLLDSINIILAFIAIFIAYKLFAKHSKYPLQTLPIRSLIVNKFFIDELYSIIFIKPLLLLSRIFGYVIDEKIINNLIFLTVGGYHKSATLFAVLQNSKVRYYALYILIGVSLISITLLKLLGDL